MKTIDRMPELLAPAGTPDAGWAAIAYGADAIYAGLPRFSARAEADNFTHEALDELIGFAHHKNRRVYITFNTLIQQHELADALETLAQISELGADGVIVQDMGVARLALRYFPQLELHASTQLAVHNLAGALELANAGFSRVVLARELSQPEISVIAKNCGIETEVFVHGALCYSYSGLCLFSSHLHGRSGNRGRCAYCCRQKFNHGDLPFSMKDLSLADHLPALIEAGVSSLKIEGRMKSPLYVAAVTDFYRQNMAGKLSPKQRAERLSDIQTIFGRPSTDLYFKKADTNPIDPTTNGHRGALIGTVEGIRKGHWLCFETNRALRKYDGLKIELPDGQKPYGFPAHEITLQNDPKKRLHFDVPAHAQIEVKLPEDHPFLPEGAPVYCSVSQEIRQRYTFDRPRPGTFRQQKPVDVTIQISAEHLRLTANGSELIIPGTFEPARQPERTAEAIRKGFEKTGDTEWKLQQLDIDDPAGLFVPASLLNDARRQLLEQLSTEYQLQQAAEHAARLETLVPETTAPGTSASVHWSIKLRDLVLLDHLTEDERAQFDEIILETNAPEPPPGLRIAPPIIQRDSFPRYASRVTQYEAANMGALYAAKENDCTDITADWPLYTLNTEAARHWQERGLSRLVLSPEDTGENIRELVRLLGDQVVVPVFQHTPLMISATRPEGDSDLTDRNGNAYRIEQNGTQYVLISTAPYSIVEHIETLQALGARRFRIDLCYGIDTAEQAADLIRDMLNGTSVPGSHDGNYFRSL